MDREFQDKINNIPNEEQQKYIQANMELRNLMTKEILDDEVYERMYEEIAKNNDIEQIEQFENSHIKESTYDKDIELLGNIISEIDNKYGFTNEELNQEFDLEVKEKRDRLNNIKSYYERNGSYIMRNINVDNLTDNEVMDMYEQIESGVGYERVHNMITDTINYEKEEERNQRLDPIRQRVEKYRTSKGIDNSNNDISPNNDVPESQIIEHTDTERKVNELKEDIDLINEDINKINGKLILGSDLTNEVNEEIKKIDSDVKELAQSAQDIIRDMDNFKDKYEQTDFSMNYQEITNELKNIKNKLRKLKQEQIKRYNNSVDTCNRAIEQLRNLNTKGIDDKLDLIEELNKCNVDISHWNDSVRYLDDIDYDKLIANNRVLSDIYNAKNNTVEDTINEEKDNNEWSITMLELYTDIENIEDDINNIESEFTEIMPENDINRLRDSIKMCSDNINAFRAKLDNNKDKLDIDDYNALEDRCNSAQEELMDLNTALNEKGLNNASISVNNKDLYEELMRRLIALRGSVENLDLLTDSLNGLMNADTINKYKELLNDRYIIDLDNLEHEIEAKYKANKLDDNQYNNLKKELDNLKNLVKTLNEKLRNPGMIKDIDIFSALNGEIDGLENALNTLEGQIENLDKPIKREDRKKIDKIIKHLENEVKRLSKIAEQYKDKNPDKYNETMERLDNVSNRLNDLNKNYRKKCPLLVKAVKSAKDFYKKHKKVILIMAGLASFALISYHVLIPAIMHGNIMIAGTTPALRPFIKSMNKILGVVIGATKDSKGIWSLANGVIINPSCAASSLLKGLAVSGIGTAALVSPLIIEIKNLINKMKNAEFKQKLKEEKDKLMENSKKKINTERKKINNGKDKVKDGIGKNKKRVKNVVPKFKEMIVKKITFDDLNYIYNDYKSSGLSLDEYAIDSGLTIEDVRIFNYLDSNRYGLKHLKFMLNECEELGLSVEEYGNKMNLDDKEIEVLQHLYDSVELTRKTNKGRK